MDVFRSFGQDLHSALGRIFRHDPQECLEVPAFRRVWKLIRLTLCLASTVLAVSMGVLCLTVCLALSVFFGAGTVWATGWVLESRRLAHESASWPMTWGALTRCESEVLSTHEQGRTYVQTLLRVKYAYDVDGKSYTSSLVSFDKRERIEAEKERLLSDYREKMQNEQRIAVYYNPSDPSEACLIPGSSPAGLYGFMLIILLAGSSIYWFLVLFVGFEDALVYVVPFGCLLLLGMCLVYLLVILAFPHEGWGAVQGFFDEIAVEMSYVFLAVRAVHALAPSPGWHRRIVTLLLFVVSVAVGLLAFVSPIWVDLLLIAFCIVGGVVLGVDLSEFRRSRVYE